MHETSDEIYVFSFHFSHEASSFLVQKSPNLRRPELEAVAVDLLAGLLERFPRGDVSLRDPSPTLPTNETSQI